MTSYRDTFSGRECADRKCSLIGTTALLLILMAIISAVLLHPYILQVDIGSREISILTILTPLIAICTLIVATASSKTLTFELTDLAVVSFMLFFLLRNVWGPENEAAIKFVIYGASLYFLASLVAQEQKLMRFLIFSLVGIALVTAVYGFFEYVVQYNYLFSPTMNKHPAGSLHRVGSLLASPVYYGCFLVQILPFSVILLRIKRAQWQTFFAVTALLLINIAVLLTYSKGSWISAVIILLSFMAVYIFRGNKNLVLPAALIVIMLFFALLFYEQIFTDLSERTEESIYIRMESWSASINEIQGNYLTGVGFRNGNQEIQNNYINKFDPYRLYFYPIDNSYLATFLEEGIIGIMLWLFVLSMLIISGVTLFQKSHSPENLFELAALGSVCGFVMNSITFDSHLIWTNIILFWIAAGIIRGFSEKIKRTENETVTSI